MELTSTQAIFVLVGVLGFFAALIGYAMKDSGTGRKVKKIFTRQAGKRDGTVVPPANKFAGPSLLFSVDDIEVSVDIVNGSRTRQCCLPGSTMIRARLPKKSEKQFSIFREETLERVEKVFGVQDIQSGDDAFDREFMIKGDDENFLKSVLTSTVSKQLLSSVGYNPIVEFTNGYFLLSVFHIVDSEEQLENLIKTALTFIERLREVES